MLCFRFKETRVLRERCLSVFDQWRITVPKGQRVRLTFASFDLVPEVCGDFVQVFDGYTAGSSSLGKYNLSQLLPVCKEEHVKNRSFITSGVTLGEGINEGFRLEGDLLIVQRMSFY